MSRQVSGEQWQIKSRVEAGVKVCDQLDARRCRLDELLQD